MKTCFVTGASGVVGSSLVPVLLRDPDTRLKLLIRAGSDDQLAGRLETLFKFWNVPAADRETRARVEALAGDTTLPQFGLTPERYRAVAAECTHIAHAAGLVRMNLPLEQARSSAVGAARNIVALARACPRLAKLDFVSTVGVGGRLPGAVPERWLTEPHAFHNTYEQAKAEAEDYLREEIEAAPLPLTVHRPSMVVGDSRNGRIINFQVFYFLCEFLSGRKTFGLYPDVGDARLDIIGCDIVAEAIAAASDDRDTVGVVFNVCSGPVGAVPIGELKLAVRKASRDRGLRVPSDHVVPRRVYAGMARLASMLAPPRQRKALATLPIFLDYLGEAQSFDDTAFRGWLAGRNIRRPAPGSYLGTILDFYYRERFASSAP